MTIHEIMAYDKDTGSATRRLASGSRGIAGAEVGKVISLNGEKLYKHRAIWLYVTGELPRKQVKFRDGDKTNYKWSNLYLDEYSNTAKTRKTTNTRSINGIYEIECTNCDTWYTASTDNFEPRKDSKLGFRSNCISCVTAKKKVYNTSDRGKFTKKNTGLLSTYGIPLERYTELLNKQDGRCAICGSTRPHINDKTNYFSVDHNHKTGEIRGLLCDNCNRGIGMLGDSISILQNAVKYLKERGTYGK